MPLRPITKHQYKVALAIFGLCFIFHLAITLLYPVAQMAPGDGQAYLSFAASMAEGNGFLSDIEPWVADRPPLYPFLLSILLRLGINNQTFIFLIQSFIFAVAAGLFYLDGVRLLGMKAGFLIGVLFAALPQFMLYTNNILTEALYLAFYVFLLSIIILPKRLKMSHCLISGIVLGLFILLRREALLIGSVLLLAVLLIRFWQHWRKVIYALVGVVVLAGIVVSPWIIRNWTLLGKPTLSSATGLNLMVCNNPIATGSYTLPPEGWLKPDPPQIVLENENSDGREMPCFEVKPQQGQTGKVYDCYFLIELSYNQQLKSRVMTWLLDNPGEILPLLGRKLLAFFSPANNWLLDGVDLLLLSLSISGIVRLVKRKNNNLKVLLIFGLVFLTQIFISLVFCGGYRYRVIIYPGLILLAAFGLPEKWLAFLSRLPGLNLFMRDPVENGEDL